MGSSMGFGELVDALWRVEELPRPQAGRPGEPEASARADRDRQRRLAAVAAAHHAGRRDGGPALVLGWCRPAPDEPVTVLTTGGPVDGSGSAGDLMLPPSGRGRRLSKDDVARVLDPLRCWVPVTPTADALLIDDAQPDPNQLPPSLEDGLLSIWHGAFGWLLIAEPLPPTVIAELSAQVAAEERDARGRSASPDFQLRAQRLARRHRELRAAESTGLWRVRLLAAAADRRSSTVVAGLLCAGTDLSPLGYTLVPAGEAAELSTLLSASDPAGAVLAGSPLVAALARTPQVEIPGVRLTPRPTFDVTPEPGPSSGTGLYLGRILDRDLRPSAALRLPVDSLNRHTFVSGATGAGKTHTIRHLLEQATAADLPWLVIEPAKAEYRATAGRAPDAGLVVIRPGDPDAPPVGINPLEPAPGFPLQTHVDQVAALFTAAFQAVEPFPQVLAAALTRSYLDQGWDLTLGEPVHPGVRPRYPTLADLQSVADRVVTGLGYGAELTSNVRGFIAVRLGSLRLGTTGRFFGAGHPLDFDRLLTRRVVLEIEDVGDDRDKAFLMGVILIRLVEHLRVRARRRPPPGGLRHLTVIEEAHRLLRRPESDGPAAHAVELFAALLAEVRAYGEGLVIAEQIPAKLIPDVIKNTAVKIVHRLPAADDRAAVGATINLSEEQSRYLVTLQPGRAGVFTDGMDHPLLVQVPDRVDREDPPGPSVSRPGTPADLIAHPVAACPPACAADPCSLRRMTNARQLLDSHPLLVVWAELAVLAHLAALPAPSPAPSFIQSLDLLDPRLLGCAVRHAVDNAVCARSSTLRTSHSPDIFAGHVAAELRAQLTSDGACTDHPVTWCAPCYRWNRVLLALHDRSADDPRAPRHPDSEQWEGEYGQPIPGSSCHEQLTTVERWSLDLIRDRHTIDAVNHGIEAPSALETAIGHRRDGPQWTIGLASALTNFTTYRGWPASILSTAADGGRRE